MVLSFLYILNMSLCKMFIYTYPRKLCSEMVCLLSKATFNQDALVKLLKLYIMLQ